MEKPRNVVIAIRLIWLCYVISIFLFLTVGIKEISSDPFVLPSYVFIFAIYALAAFINCKISCGRNWARVFSMVNFVCAALFYCFYLLLPIRQVIQSTYVMFTLPVFIIKGFALFLLFTQPASAWFRNSKLGKKGKIFFITACSLIVIFYAGVVAFAIFCSNNLAWLASSQGYDFAEAGRYDKAIEQYSLSIKADPNYGYAYMARAYAYEKLANTTLQNATEKKLANSAMIPGDRRVNVICSASVHSND